ncbi:MAG: hypothetical protein ACYC0B_00735 [Gemmatimonadaceae bacterium]
MVAPRALRAAVLLATLVTTVVMCPGALMAQAAEELPQEQLPQARAKSLVDSVRPYLVFAPRHETWFVATSRAKRMLVDIGRVDLEVRRDSALGAAYREAVATASPVPPGSTFLLRGPWGLERVRADSVDTWNGRIVLVLEGSAAMDSAAAGRVAVVASAHLEPAEAGEAKSRDAKSPAPLPTTSPRCDRAPVTGVLAERVQAVRDSLEYAMRGEGLPIYERLARRVTASSSHVTGCFGDARVALAVSLRSANSEWTRERMVLVDTLGRVQPLKVEDFRFRAHDLLHALDADGDGIDDLAAIGRTFLAGGTTVMLYDPTARRLVRLAAGFSWENR